MGCSRILIFYLVAAVLYIPCVLTVFHMSLNQTI